MPEQFENGRKLDGKNSLQDFDAKEVCLHPKSRSVSFQKRLKCSFFVIFKCLHDAVSKMCRLEFRFRFQNLPAKKCRFRVNGRPSRRIFHRFQNVPASCECSLNAYPDHPPRQPKGEQKFITQMVGDRHIFLHITGTRH